LSRCLGPLSIAAVLLAAGCASTGPSAGRQERAQAPPPPTAITDASYDWHVLVLEPFGVLLKESPLPLHEVLLFHDETSRTDNDNKDCYSIEGTPPRFLGARPDHYLLCFDHDRLTRIDAAVRLAVDEAPQVFARGCALWLKDTAASMGSRTACEGRDGTVAFSARLVLLPGDATATASMTLSDASSTEPAHDLPGK
jgi:hypothetical protein